MEKHIVTSLVVIAGTLAAWYFPDHKGVSASIIANLYWIWKG